MSDVAQADGPDFSSPLSKPHTGAVRAFRLPAERLAPMVDPAMSHGLTDAGQAAKFVERFGSEFRFDHSRRIWMRWNDHYWSQDRDGEPKRRAIGLAEDLYLSAADETNLKTREVVASFAIKQQSRRKVEDLLELVKVMPPVAEAGDRWNANSFLTATPWGVFDFISGAGRDGRPEDRITYRTNAKFDPTARCERFLAFLEEVFDDAELIAYLQRALGYSATGDMREQVIFLCFGAGANGKSTLIDTIAYVLGDYSYAAPFSTFEAGQRSEIGADVAALAGRRFITSSETNAHSKFNEARLKALSGGDRMNARHLYGNPFEFHPVGKVWLGVNHRPAVADDSYGFWRRMHLIPFTRTFSGSQDDKNLKSTLRAEASGILNWLIAGAQAWLREGLNPPAAVLAARDDYQRENDPLAEFIEDQCLTDAEARCAAAQLWEAYKAWCQRQNAKGLGRKQFGSLMARRVESRHTEFGRLYVGIGLRG